MSIPVGFVHGELFTALANRGGEEDQPQAASDVKPSLDRPAAKGHELRQVRSLRRREEGVEDTWLSFVRLRCATRTISSLTVDVARRFKEECANSDHINLAPEIESAPSNGLA